jgi:hypothetical protein
MGKNAILVRTLAKARINEVAPATGDDTFSYSSAPRCQTGCAPQKRLTHTDGSPDILDRVGLPEFLIGRSETEMREDKVGNEAVDMRLQQNPGRLWFDTRGESAGTDDIHHEAYHAVKN